MFNEITNGISVKLNEIFGDGYEIYPDQIKQDLKEPCFFIKHLNPNRSQIVGKRYTSNNPIDIHYFPLKPDDSSEINDVASKLYDGLEWINVGVDLVRGTQMSHEINDGVLHFFIQFNMILVKTSTDPIDNMETITIDVEI